MSFCSERACRSCEEQDNCAMCGCDGGGCETEPEPHYDCDDYRPQWGD